MALLAWMPGVARATETTESLGYRSSPSLTLAAEEAFRAFEGSGYESATVTFALLDGESGEVLFEREASRAVVPASIVKAITTAATLEHFTPEHRFTTTLEASGSTTTDGLLTGDLIIRGGGDPSLGSTRVDGALSSTTLLDEWTSVVLAAGIRHIEGSVKGDAACFSADPVPDSFEWVDIGNGYGTGTSGLCFHDNIYHVSFRPADTVGDPAPIVGTDPPMPELLWTNEMRTGPVGSGDQGNIYGAPFSDKRWARGTIPQGKPEFSIKGSLPDPAATLARLLHDRLVSAGVRIDGGSQSVHGTACTTDTRVLTRTLSPPLADIMFKLNKQSVNLYAETLLLHLATATGNGSREAGVQAVRRFLRKHNVPPGGMTLRDGSGLARNDSVTAMGMARFFFAMQKQPHHEVWRHSLPVLGVDADLGARAKGTAIQGKVHAKTGYLGGPPSRTLSGYLEGKSGRRYCFAFLVNHHSKSYREVDKDVDAALLKIHEEL